jgi:hypothetical protein
MTRRLACLRRVGGAPREVLYARMKTGSAATRPLARSITMAWPSLGRRRVGDQTLRVQAIFPSEWVALSASALGSTDMSLAHEIQPEQAPYR